MPPPPPVEVEKYRWSRDVGTKAPTPRGSLVRVLQQERKGLAALGQYKHFFFLLLRDAPYLPIAHGAAVTGGTDAVPRKSGGTFVT